MGRNIALSLLSLFFLCTSCAHTAAPRLCSSALFDVREELLASGHVFVERMRTENFLHAGISIQAELFLKRDLSSATALLYLDADLAEVILRRTSAEGVMFCVEASSGKGAGDGEKKKGIIRKKIDGPSGRA